MYFKKPALIFSFVLIVLFSNVVPVWGVSLDAVINTKEPLMYPTFTFSRSVIIEYPENATNMKKIISENKHEIKINMNSTYGKLDDFMIKINNSLKHAKSIATVNDVELDYAVQIADKDSKAELVFLLRLTPTIANFTLPLDSENNVIIDSMWRKITIEEPIVLTMEKYGEIDINRPISFLKTQIPQLYVHIKETEIEQALAKPLINSNALGDSLSNWVFQQDPPGFAKKLERDLNSNRVVSITTNDNLANMDEVIGYEVTFTDGDNTYNTIIREMGHQAQIIMNGIGTFVIKNNVEVFLSNFDNQTIDKYFQSIPSPLKQFKSGILSDEIQCKDELTLLIKHNGYPACVKSETKIKLIERGWGK